MKDSLSILSYISRTSPSILTSVHNAMDKIYKSLVAHGYEVCDWDADRINGEVASLLEYTLYDSETCKYAIMMETSLIAIASNISDAVFEFCRKRNYENIIGFESYYSFNLNFEKSAMLDSEHRSLANVYYHMKSDLLRHGFKKREIFQMMQDIVKELAVVNQSFEKYFGNISTKDDVKDKEETPTITPDPDKKANRIGSHIEKNNTDSKPDKIELFDATDYDEDNPEFEKFPDWLKEELQEINDLQDSSDEDDDDDEELTPEEMENLTPGELIDRLIKIINTRDEDDDEDDNELTPEDGSKIRDRIVRHAFCDKILRPYLQPYLIYNGASQEGKGISFARDMLEKALHNYYLQYGTNECFQNSYDEDDEEELTQEELIDHAMVCLMDQIDDKIESEVDRKFREAFPQYRRMKSRFIFEYPALASFLFGFPF